MSPQTPNHMKRILVVDDESDITDALTINLEATGRFEVHSTNDPTCAVEKARSVKPDAIILDIVMPIMDGGDVQRAIRENSEFKNTPIIFCSALVSNEEVGEGAREGGGDYILAKPVRLAVLVKLIDEVTQ